MQTLTLKNFLHVKKDKFIIHRFRTHILIYTFNQVTKLNIKQQQSYK